MKKEKGKEKSNVILFELRKKLQEAVASGRFFITITKVIEDKEKRLLDHYTITNQFPTEDIVPTLEHFAKKFIGEDLIGE